MRVVQSATAANPESSKNYYSYQDIGHFAQPLKKGNAKLRSCEMGLVRSDVPLMLCGSFNPRRASINFPFSTGMPTLRLQPYQLCVPEHMPINGRWPGRVRDGLGVLESRLASSLGPAGRSPPRILTRVNFASAPMMRCSFMKVAGSSCSG